MIRGSMVQWTSASNQINDSLNQWINESMNERATESMNQWVNGQWFNGSMIRWVSRWHGSTIQWVNESMNQWISESTNHWAHQSRNLWIIVSMNQATKWTNESMNFANLISQKVLRSPSFFAISKCKARTLKCKPNPRYSLVHILPTSSPKSAPIPPGFCILKRKSNSN